MLSHYDPSNLHKHLSFEKREYVLSKQLLRSGTPIGANVAEANQAQSRADFVSKLSIALKEAVETEFWINLLRDSQYFREASGGLNPNRLCRIDKAFNGNLEIFAQEFALAVRHELSIINYQL